MLVIVTNFRPFHKLGMDNNASTKRESGIKSVSKLCLCTHLGITFSQHVIQIFSGIYHILNAETE